MRVMFVDDETQVLKGITRMLDCDDVDWDIETATNGLDALEAMEEEPVDVLVSDMKMPGMDGAQLLDEVSRLYPDTVRIILSGQASKDAVYRAVTPMHQFLAKPCEAGVLRTAVQRACALREVLDSTTSHKFLGRISSLPSLPTLYEEVIAESESENGTVARVGEIVAQDPAMTAKILQLANSAIFGVRSTITSPSQAASVIGMDTLKSLVLTLQVFKSFDGALIPGFSIDELFSHSTRVATIAQRIAKSESLEKGSSNEAFTAGLLHDVGKLILAANAPTEFAEAIADANANGISLVEAESAKFGLGHDGIGGYLLALWGLPQSIVEAVTFHHQPEQCYGVGLSTPTLVYIANYLSHEECGKASDEQTRLCEDLLSQLGVIDRLDDWRSIVCEKEA
ncbi:HDOD domain-containing protein [Planctomycetota bacterium]